MTGAVEQTIRIEGGRVLATLIRFTRDFDLAEDALQDATMAALEHWTTKGVPENPAAWLTTVARNKALDRIRRESRRRAKEMEAALSLIDPEQSSRQDDRLRLIFTCCHPALSPETRVALTLRTVGGLTTEEIARAFLVPTATMGQRISRAKRKIAVARIPYRIPADHDLPDRLEAVLAVLYLVFTTGHHSPTGNLDSRIDLAEEAVRQARLLADLMPDEPECSGLLALMLATHARRRARVDGNGDVILLADQERGLWDREAIAEASLIIDRTLRRQHIGPYQIQAAIACLHGQATSDEATDWKQIVDLYRMLETVTPTPVVRVNRAVAEAKVFGAATGLALLDGVDGMQRWHLYWSVKAELSRQAGLTDAAREAYREALSCDMNESDRRLIERRVASI